MRDVPRPAPAEDVFVRPLLAVEVPEAVAIIRAAHQAAGTLSDRYDAAALHRRLLAGTLRDSDDGPAFLAASWGATTVAGVVGVARSFCSFRGWEVGFLAVHPGCQGRGIARLLVGRALDEARAAGGEFVLARAHHPPLFESCGFRRIGDGDRLPALMVAALG